MWKRMKRYAGGGLVNTMYLLGAARANNELKDNGKEDMIEMTEQNIIVNHAYTLLEAKEVGLTGQAEKVSPCTKTKGEWLAGHGDEVGRIARVDLPLAAVTTAEHSRALLCMTEWGRSSCVARHERACTHAQARTLYPVCAQLNRPPHTPGPPLCLHCQPLRGLSAKPLPTHHGTPSPLLPLTPVRHPAPLPSPSR